MEDVFCCISKSACAFARLWILQICPSETTLSTALSQMELAVSTIFSALSKRLSPARSASFGDFPSFNASTIFSVTAASSPCSIRFISCSSRRFSAVSGTSLATSHIQSAFVCSSAVSPASSITLSICFANAGSSATV